MSVNDTELADSQKETGRIEAFSDGVFAIAITLLVLDIKVPPDLSSSTTLFDTLVKQEWPVYLAYIISFATIGIMWINHHRLLTLIRRSDHTLLLLNTFLLFWVTFVPFPTSLLARSLQGKPDVAMIGAMVYSATFFLISVAFNLLWRYASYKSRLIDKNANPDSVRAISGAYAFGPLLYMVAFAVAFVSAPASVVLNLLFAVFFALPERAGRSLYNVRNQEPHSTPGPQE